MDYEKLHKYIINKLQQMVSCGKITVEIARGICADFVPESEDERIRKTLISHFCSIRDNCSKDWYGFNINDVIAWLEKQGENNMGISEATKQKLKNKLNKALEKETPESWNKFLDKQGEQKPADKVEPKFKVGQTIKKEGFNLGFTIVKIEDGFYYNDIGNHFPFTDQDNWELVEQRPAWSEEDEDILNTIINHFKVDIECTDEDDIVRWLKSLKDRYAWKPSEEQMKALTFACIKNANIDKSSIKALYDLKEQLKKLREE